MMTSTFYIPATFLISEIYFIQDKIFWQTFCTWAKVLLFRKKNVFAYLG